MALLGNVGYHARGPVRNFGILSPGTEAANFRQSGQLKNFPLHEGASDGALKTGYPSGYRHPYAHSMAIQTGGLRSARESEGTATVSGSMAAGRNITGTADGTSTASGIAQLVVSGAGSASGVASVSGNLKAALVGSASASGSATVSGTMGAIAWCSGNVSGVASASLTSYATGRLVGSIAPAVTLEASSFSTYLLDAEDIETGLTLRHALRLIAAATAGKVSGASGSTVTIRSAVADSKDRIVANVDSSGNRTAVVYDMSD